jgi:hypothetical protein
MVSSALMVGGESPGGGGSGVSAQSSLGGGVSMGAWESIPGGGGGP